MRSNGSKNVQEKIKPNKNIIKAIKISNEELEGWGDETKNIF